MAGLARFSLDTGGWVTVETAEEPGVAPAALAAKVVREARVSFETAMVEVRDAASAALAQFQAMSRPPDEVEITFGVNLDAEAGAVIAKAGVRGHFEVSVTWRREDRPR